MIANARSLQRVLRVTPNTTVAQTLLTLGFKSATQIANLSEQAFFRKATAAGLTKPEANRRIGRVTALCATGGHLYSIQLGFGWSSAAGHGTACRHYESCSAGRAA